MARRVIRRMLGAVAVLVGCSAGEKAEPIPDGLWRVDDPDGYYDHVGEYSFGEGVIISEFVTNDFDKPNHLVAVERETGELKWDFDLPESTQREVLLTPVVVEGGRAFFVEYHSLTAGELVAVDLATGAALWRRSEVDSIYPALAAAGGTVAVATETGIDFLDPGTGSVVATASAARGVQLAAGEDVVLVMDAGGLLTAVDAADPSTVQWSLTIGLAKQFRGALEVRDGVVVVDTGDDIRTLAMASGEPLATIAARPAGGGFFDGGDLVSFDLRTGDEQWRLTPADLGAERIGYVSEEAGGALAVSTDVGVATVDAGSGSVWSTTVVGSGQWSTTAVFTTGTTTYYTERTNKAINNATALVALDPRTGERRWRATSRGHDFDSALIDGVLVTNQGPTLVALP